MKSVGINGEVICEMAKWNRKLIITLGNNPFIFELDELVETMKREKLYEKAFEVEFFQLVNNLNNKKNALLITDAIIEKINELIRRIKQTLNKDKIIVSDATQGIGVKVAIENEVKSNLEESIEYFTLLKKVYKNIRAQILS